VRYWGVFPNDRPRQTPEFRTLPRSAQIARCRSGRRSGTSSSSVARRLREPHAAVGRERPVRVVGDLPRVAVRVDEHGAVAAPERLRRLAPDPRARGPRLLGDLVDLARRAEVERKRDPAPAPGVLDAAVVGELRPVPERERRSSHRCFTPMHARARIDSRGRPARRWISPCHAARARAGAGRLAARTCRRDRRWDARACEAGSVSARALERIARRERRCHRAAACDGALQEASRPCAHRPDLVAGLGSVPAARHLPCRLLSQAPRSARSKLMTRCASDSATAAPPIRSAARRRPRCRRCTSPATS
jgi:hypothetical protein